MKPIELLVVKLKLNKLKQKINDEMSRRRMSETGCGCQTPQRRLTKGKPTGFIN